MSTISHPPRCRNSGFSLIELIFTLVLLGILTGLAAPNMSGYIDRTEVDSALNQLTSDIAYTRALAIKSGEGARLWIDDGTSYTIRRSDGAGVAKRVDLMRDFLGVRLEPVPPLELPLDLHFDSRGLLVNPKNAGLLKAHQGEQAGTLRILTSGRAFRED